MPLTSFGLRIARRSATRQPSEWPTRTAGAELLALEQQRQAVGERLQVGQRRERRRAAVTGQVRHEHAVPAGELGRELDPVGRGTAQAVDEHDRRAVPADEPAEPHALLRGASRSSKPLAGRLVALTTGRPLFFEDDELCVGGRAL